MFKYDIIVVGGGAAGFFAAINTARLNPNLKVAILERGNAVLSKVKISGGGRCNVTHAEFIPDYLVKNYPRGEKELKGPFCSFMTGDVMDWFESRGVPLKIEGDGRVFPVSNSSQTIIDCFLNEAKTYGVELKKNHSVRSFSSEKNGWNIQTNKADFYCHKLLISTGSNPKIWKLLKTIGLTIIEPVPSLFTFDIDDERIKDIPGVVVKKVSVEVVGTSLKSEGPLLITHSGMSAPSILKLSAFGAIDFFKMNYNFEIKINFIGTDLIDCQNFLLKNKLLMSKKYVVNTPLFDLPKRLWRKLIYYTLRNHSLRWAEINKIQIQKLSEELTSGIFKVHGKSTFKEEFVTAGGIDLKEINFKTFESKRYKNLFFCGEILNIDGVTGGFNFQNAWTGAYIASHNLSK